MQEILSPAAVGATTAVAVAVACYYFSTRSKAQADCDEVQSTPSTESIMAEVVDGFEINAKKNSPPKLKRQLSEYSAKLQEGKAGLVEIASKYYPAYAAELPSMEGKVVAITGCTSGTGHVLAMTLIKKRAKLIALNRPSGRHTLAMAKLDALAKQSGAPEIASIPCDLASFASVHAAGASLRNACAECGLDGLVNNAGIMAFNDDATEDGLDVQMQSNHTSHFLLAKYALPCLERAVALRGDARIVNHSSVLRALDDKGWENSLKPEYLGKNGGRLGGNKASVGAPSGPNYQRYQQTKLANVVFTYALDERLRAAGSEVKALVAHPGVAATALHLTAAMGGDVPAIPLPGFLLRFLLRQLMQSEEDGTMGLLKCLCDPHAVSGQFYGPVGKGLVGGKHDTAAYSGPAMLMPTETLADESARTLLWSVSEEAVGESFEIGSVACTTSDSLLGAFATRAADAGRLAGAS